MGMSMEIGIRMCKVQIRRLSLPGNPKPIYLASVALLPDLVGHGDTPHEAVEDLAARAGALLLPIPPGYEQFLPGTCGNYHPPQMMMN